MGKYSLIVEDELSIKTKVIFIKDNKKSTRTNLLTIDAFTTNFINSNELGIYLKNKIKNINTIKCIYIVDNNNNIKDIAYSDKSILNKISLIENKINTNTHVYKELLFTLLKEIENNDFFNYIINRIDIDLSQPIKNRIIKGD